MRVLFAHGEGLLALYAALGVALLLTAITIGVRAYKGLHAPEEDPSSHRRTRLLVTLGLACGIAMWVLFVVATITSG